VGSDPLLSLYSESWRCLGCFNCAICTCIFSLVSYMERKWESSKHGYEETGNSNVCVRYCCVSGLLFEVEAAELKMQLESLFYH
jgi:hypothetical protein